MNNRMTIALFGTVVAIAAGVISTGAYSELSIQSNDVLPAQGFNILGHAEYIVTDSGGNIKAYQQTDNFVAREGKDCVANMLFLNNTMSICSPSASFTGFNYIAIGNGTGAAAETATALSTTSGGEVARSTQLVPTFTDAATNAESSRVALTYAFTIDDTIGSTTVRDSGLFDTSSGGNMFAILDIPSGGVGVASGDQLTVNWQIDIG